MRHLFLGLLLAVCVAYPHPVVHVAAPAAAALQWLTTRPAVTAAAAGWALSKGLRARARRSS